MGGLGLSFVVGGASETSPPHPGSIPPFWLLADHFPLSGEGGRALHSIDEAAVLTPVRESFITAITPREVGGWWGLVIRSIKNTLVS